MLTGQDIQRIGELLAPKFGEIGCKFESLEESISNLAKMTKRGFDNCVTKEEFNEFKDEMYSFKEGVDIFKSKTEQSLFSLDSKVDEISNKVDKIEEKLEPLYAGYSIMQKEIQQVNYRMDRVEEKVGVEN